MSIIWQCLAYCNSCVNPIIYNHTSKDFRDAFRGAFSSTIREGSTRALSGFGRSALGQQRSMKPPDEANDVAITQLNLHDLHQPLQQQQQLNGADDVESLSDCSNRVHLED